MIDNKYIVHLFIICFLIYTPISLGQEIKFEIYMKDACVDSISKLMFFNLRKNGVNYNPENNDGVIFLKEKGKYELTTIYSEYSVFYELNDFNNVIDTILTPKIRLCLEPTSHPNFVGYCCCEAICNGTQLDYYSNGNKRLEGDFKNGKPIDNLNFYNTEGVLVRVVKYNKKGIMTGQKNNTEKKSNN